MAEAFKLEHVLAVASKHPFYSSNTYPLTPDEIADVVVNTPFSDSISSVEVLLGKFPIMQKDDM